MLVPTADLLALDHDCCWALLQSQSLGRLAFTDRAMPAIRPVNYTVDGTHLVFRVSAELASRLDGQVVAFEVDDIDRDEHTGVSVVATGIMRRLVDPNDTTRADVHQPSWVSHAETACLRLTIGQLDGRRLHRRSESS
jgi:nitroimidazol reductase NimA-like FMN-containing flavoprotein (pyridoxamine 5'-phosphate oxidase superfamily)